MAKNKGKPTDMVCPSCSGSGKDKSEKMRGIDFGPDDKYSESAVPGQGWGPPPDCSPCSGSGRVAGPPA